MSINFVSFRLILFSLLVWLVAMPTRGSEPSYRQFLEADTPAYTPSMQQLLDAGFNVDMATAIIFLCRATP